MEWSPLYPLVVCTEQRSVRDNWKSTKKTRRHNGIPNKLLVCARLLSGTHNNNNSRNTGTARLPYTVAPQPPTPLVHPYPAVRHRRRLRQPTVRLFLFFFPLRRPIVVYVFYTSIICSTCPPVSCETRVRRLRLVYLRLVSACIIHVLGICAFRENFVRTSRPDSTRRIFFDSRASVFQRIRVTSRGVIPILFFV